jgi:predicted neuraminidase
MNLITAVLLVCSAGGAAEGPEYRAEFVFPLHAQHNHAPGIVECPGGDLLVSWYRGSGERSADDVAVFGARRPKGSGPWSEPFLMADRPGFPDCNTAMMIDRHERLWLFWPTVLANSWESCLTNFRVAESKDDGLSWGPVGTSELPNPGSGLDGVRLASGRWLLVYNDTTEGRNSLAVSLSDDQGQTWKWTRHLERHPTGSYHYPAVIEGRDGSIHVVYSYFVEGGKSMKHAAFNEPWVEAGD